jgi:2-keto-3-deoxy-6-phosphogluconate aldolase
VKPHRRIPGIVAEFSDPRIEAQMGQSTYEIRVAGTVPLDLLENFRQIETVEPAGTILHAKQLDDAALWGLIDALRNAGIDLIEIRHEVTTASDGALH